MKQKVVLEQKSEQLDRAEVVREELRHVYGEIGKLNANLSRLLHESYTNAYYIKWGFESFKDYVEDEIGLKYSYVIKLLTMAEKITKYKISWEQVAKIGVSKMRTIALVMDDGNKKELLKKAGELSLVKLTEDVKKHKSTLTVTGLDKVITLSVRLDEDQAAIVMGAIEQAKELRETDSISIALEHIAYEWVMQNKDEGAKNVTISDVIAWAEKAYGVKLVAAGPQDLTEVLGDGEED